ncbi:MAG TPA: PHP domain-containing protein [Acidimicrobiales bacterium]|nr:PHP domain-containing protein [Acidimicrobiales bacterium]
MDPFAALDRIVYLLDRELAPAPKVKAFVRARELVQEMDRDELRQLHAEGRLKDLPGIGDSTGGVIAEALDGKVPAYLTKLETSSAIPIGEGEAIRAALKGDCHTHSEWSDGGAPIEVMAKAARQLGHDYMVLTDHSARLTIAHGLSAERLEQQLEEVERLNDELAPFRILTGMEVDILEDGGLDMTDEMLAKLDVVVASVHSKLSMERTEMTRRMVLAMANPHTDILGHCTGRKVVGRGRPQSKFDAELVFAACAKFDKAVEINCRPERQDPPEELLQLALDWGCKVSIDTDAHAPGQLEWQPYGCDKAARMGIEPSEIVNAMSADDLIAWAGSHPNE